MSKKLLNKIILFSIALVIYIIINPKECFAGVSLSKNSVELNTGGTTKVTLTATEATGTISVKTSDSDIVTANSTNWIENNSITINITAGNKAGNATIYVTGIVSDSKGEESSVDNSIAVSVKNASSSSNTSNSETNIITSLKIGDNTYSKPNNDITIGTVDASTESIVVKPTTSNGASYTINGGNSTTVPLKTGTNLITIKVEGGSTYKVRLTRLAKDIEVKPNIIEETENKIEEEEKEEDKELILTSLNVEDLELTPEFNSNIYSYTINVDMQKKNINSLNIKAVPNEADATVEVIGNENLIEGENIITILLKSSDETKSTVYQIVVNKNDASSEIVSDSNIYNIAFLSNLTSFQKNIVIGFAIFILLLVIVVIIILIRKARRNRKEQMKYEEVNVNTQGEQEDSTMKEIENFEEYILKEDTSEKAEEKQSFVDNTKKETTLDQEKATLMDEFFSYNNVKKEDIKSNEKITRKKGKGKHF